MAIASVTVDRGDDVLGNLRVKIVTVVHSGTYTTGGDSLTLAQLGLSSLARMIDARPVAPTYGTHVCASYDSTNQKLMLITGTGAELANGQTTTGTYKLTFLGT